MTKTPKHSLGRKTRTHNVTECSKINCGQGKVGEHKFLKRANWWIGGVGAGGGQLSRYNDDLDSGNQSENSPKLKLL